MRCKQLQRRFVVFEAVAPSGTRIHPNPCLPAGCCAITPHRSSSNATSTSCGSNRNSLMNRGEPAANISSWPIKQKTLIQIVQVIIFKLQIAITEVISCCKQRRWCNGVASSPVSTGCGSNTGCHWSFDRTEHRCNIFQSLETL